MAVRNLRIDQNLTQEGLAAAARVDRTYVSGLERGVRNPALSTVERIADALGISMSRLFARVERLRAEA